MSPSRCARWLFASLATVGCERGEPPFIDDAFVIADTGQRADDSVLEGCAVGRPPAEASRDAGKCGEEAKTCATFRSDVLAALRACTPTICWYCGSFDVALDPSGCPTRIAMRGNNVVTPTRDGLACALERLSGHVWPCAGGTTARVDDDSCE